MRSFRTSDWFATLNGPKHVKEPMIILHAGAKAKGIVLKDRILEDDLPAIVAEPLDQAGWIGDAVLPHLRLVRHAERAEACEGTDDHPACGCQGERHRAEG